MSIVTMISVISEAVAILGTIGGVMYFFGVLGNRVSNLEEKACVNAEDHKIISDMSYDTQRKVAGLESSVGSIKEVVFRIDDKIDRMMERGDK